VWKSSINLKRNEMARISKYDVDSTIAAGDKLLGTDATTGNTKSYTLSDIGLFVDTDTTYTAGTGLDLSTTTFSIDVSDFLTNGVNNRVLTATGTDAMNSEANLTFDGSTLVLTGSNTVSGDTDITGSALVTQNLRRTVTTATESPTNTFTCVLTANDNFQFTANNAASQVIALTVASENVGQSGTIIITNPSSVGSLAYSALPSYMITPESATINFVTTANAISIISYYVYATDKVLVNYVGNFG
tara:strand:+ start:899 stop:1636 length:738 start_codon:yes stop_codon:yes gene_type:complete